MKAALSHLRVLDLSRVLAGPGPRSCWAISAPRSSRLNGPVSATTRAAGGRPTTAASPTRDSAYYLCANRNKRSVTIDITHPAGQPLVRALAAGRRAGRELQARRPGAVRPRPRLAREPIPRLVYCSITGFGQAGPYAPRAGYDFLVQGMGGLMSVTGLPDAEEGAGPIKVGVALTDILTGLYAATAILAALASRHRTGDGQRIDLALLDVQVACLANQSMNHLYPAPPPAAWAMPTPNACPTRTFPPPTAT